MHFQRYLEHFFPKLTEALRNHASHALCSIAVGIVGDLARALNKDLVPLCDPLMNLLLEAIQVRQAPPRTPTPEAPRARARPRIPSWTGP